MLSHGFFVAKNTAQQIALSEVAIRKARLSDAQQLPLLASTTYRETYRDYFSQQDLDILFGADYQNKLPTELQDTHIQYLVCEQDGQLIGYSKLLYRQNDVFLDKLYILQSHQGQGLGTKMLMQGYQLALENSYNTMRLSTGEHRPSIPFYEKNGFMQAGRDIYVKPSGEVTSEYNVVMVCHDIKAALEQVSQNKIEHPRFPH